VWATYIKGGNLVDCRGVVCSPGDLCVVSPELVEDPRGRFELAEGDDGEWAADDLTWVVSNGRL